MLLLIIVNSYKHIAHHNMLLCMCAYFYAHVRVRLYRDWRPSADLLCCACVCLSLLHYLCLTEKSPCSLGCSLHYQSVILFCFRQFLLRQFLLYAMAVCRRSVGTRPPPLATRSTPYPAGQGSRPATPQAGADSQPSPVLASGSVSSIVAGQLTSVVQTSLQPLLDRISVLEKLLTSAANSTNPTTSSTIYASATSAAMSSAMPVSVADITLPSPTIASP